MNDAGMPTVDRKPTRLESALTDDQTVLERANKLRVRVEEMEVRLFGDQPEVAADGTALESGPGILGQFNSTNADTVRVLEALSASLTRIESAI